MAAVPPFALAPALVGAGQPMDYSTRAGQHLYPTATTELPYKFNGKETSLPAFLQAVRDHLAKSGWDDIFEITTDAGPRNLLVQYGEITVENVRADALLDYIGQPVRNTQISHQIHQCLKKSISPDIAEHMVTESANFMINDMFDVSASKTKCRCRSVKQRT